MELRILRILREWTLNLFVVVVVVVTLSACSCGNVSRDEDECDSTTETSTSRVGEYEESDLKSLNGTFEGVVVDEMMSTVTIAINDGDTVWLIKGESYESDAAIGDKVEVSFEKSGDELRAVRISRI